MMDSTFSKISHCRLFFPRSWWLLPDEAAPWLVNSLEGAVRGLFKNDSILKPILYFCKDFARMRKVRSSGERQTAIQQESPVCEIEGG